MEGRLKKFVTEKMNDGLSRSAQKFRPYTKKRETTTTTRPGMFHADLEDEDDGLLGQTVPTFPMRGFQQPVIRKDSAVKDIAPLIELLPPLLPPVGCGPIADVNWLKLGTAERIIALRDETIMTMEGWTCGDRTWRRCKMRAEHDIDRFRNLSRDMQAKVLEQGLRGLDVSRSSQSATYQLQTKNGVVETRQSVTVVRAPMFAILKAFAPILDKSWHRYMFPFGCYFLSRNSPNFPEVRNRDNVHNADIVDTGLWDEWRRDLLVKNTTGNPINPCSVSAADILYLCNVRGYIDRLLYTMLVVEWAKEHGVNLLVHQRIVTSEGGSPSLGERPEAATQFISLEKHLHFFGCIHNHLETIRTNYNFVGGYWDEKLKQMKQLYESLQARFNITPGTLDAEFRPFLIHEVGEGRNAITDIFKNAGRVAERPRA